MAVTLYKRQRQIVDFISQFIQKNGYSPTLSEIAGAIGVSSLATVHEYLQALIKKKGIRKYDGAIGGNEMIDEGIFDKDFVVIEEEDIGNVRDGDIVVALLENGLATLKRFFKEKTRIRLEPANSTMSPLFAPNLRIQGRVVGVIRKFKPLN